MTKILLVSSIFTYLLTGTLIAKDTNNTTVAYENEVSFLVGDSENGSEQGLDRSIAYELQYMYRGFDFPIKPEVALVHSNNIPIYYSKEKASYSSLLLNGVYEIKYIDLLTPYVKAGLGYRHSVDTTKYAKDHLLFNTGGGLKLRLSSHWSIKAEVQANFSNERDNLLAMLGVTYAFGEKEQEHIEKAPIKQEPKVIAREAMVVKEVPKAIVAAVSTPKVSKAVVVTPVPIILAKKQPIEELDIQFKFNSAELTAASKETLKQYAKTIEIDDRSTIHIIGNTDSMGDDNYNLKLSLQRANAVKDELVKNSIPAERISAEGDGENNPVASNETAEGREKNRRVSIVFSERK